MTRPWFHRWLTRPAQTSLRKQQPKAKPTVQIVEGRCLLDGYQFTTLDVLGSSATLAYGANNAGQIVGEYFAGPFRDLRIHGFLFSGGNYATIDPLGSIDASALGINDAGQIVGTYTDACGVIHGFLLSGGSYTTFDVPGGLLTEAHGINETERR
jgi:probable HAF family extracellular repeat protein